MNGSEPSPKRSRIQAQLEGGDVLRQSNLSGTDNVADDGENSKLFGHDAAWEAILESAHDLVSEKSPANSITELMEAVKSATSIFEKPSQGRHLDDDDVESLNSGLKTKIAAIGVNIKTLELPNGVAKASKFLRDICTHAIPSLVFLLESALAYPTDENGGDDLLFLKLKISLQDYIIHLCKKIGPWKLHANLDTTAMDPNLQIIRKNLSPMMRACQAELKRLKYLEYRELQKHKARTLAESHQRLDEKMKQDREENSRKRRENAFKTRDDLDRRHHSLFNSCQRKGKQPPDHQIISINEWTHEEDLELMVQLQDPDISYLPGTGFQLN